MRLNCHFFVLVLTVMLFCVQTDALLKKKFLIKKLIKVGVLAKLVKGKTKVIIPLIIPFHVSKFRGFPSFGGWSGGGWSSGGGSGWSGSGMSSYNPIPMPISNGNMEGGYGAGSGWDMGSNGISEPMPMPSSGWGGGGYEPSTDYSNGGSVGDESGYGMPSPHTGGLDSGYESTSGSKGISMTLSVGGSGYSPSGWSDAGQQPSQMLDDSSSNYPAMSRYSMRTMEHSAQSDYGQAPPTDTSAETMTANGAGW